MNHPVGIGSHLNQRKGPFVAAGFIVEGHLQGHDFVRVVTVIIAVAIIKIDIILCRMSDGLSLRVPSGGI